MEKFASRETIPLRWARCATAAWVRASFPISTTFDLFYRPVSFIARDEEVEIDEGEAELGFYEKNGIELEDVLREQVLLALPMQRVCSESCKGICPGCGKNRNEHACGCAPWRRRCALERSPESRPLSRSPVPYAGAPAATAVEVRITISLRYSAQRCSLPSIRRGMDMAIWRACVRNSHFSTLHTLVASPSPATRVRRRSGAWDKRRPTMPAN